MKKMVVVIMTVVVVFGLTSLVKAGDVRRVSTVQSESAYYEFLMPADIAQADETKTYEDGTIVYYKTVEVVEAKNVASIASMKAMYFNEEGDLVDAYEVLRSPCKAKIRFARYEIGGDGLTYDDIAGKTGFITVDIMRVIKK